MIQKYNHYMYIVCSRRLGTDGKVTQWSLWCLVFSFETLNKLINIITSVKRFRSSCYLFFCACEIACILCSSQLVFKSIMYNVCFSGVAFRALIFYCITRRLGILVLDRSNVKNRERNNSLCQYLQKDKLSRVPALLYKGVQFYRELFSA